MLFDPGQPLVPIVVAPTISEAPAEVPILYEVTLPTALPILTDKVVVLPKQIGEGDNVILAEGTG